MRRILVVFLTFCTCAGTTAQIQVAVRTDRLSYQYGDTVGIIVTAHNPTADTVRLWFPSSCQASCIVDDLNFADHVECYLVVTSKTIPPNSAATWDHLKYPARNAGHPLLSLGPHAVVGEVLGYAKSDTLHFLVTPVTSVVVDQLIPGEFRLDQNYPNPFNPSTTIRYGLPNRSLVTLTVFNTLGQQVALLQNGEQEAGYHEVRFDAKKLSSGLYFYRIQAGEFAATKRLLLLH
jgi:hypothetical protein